MDIDDRIKVVSAANGIPTNKSEGKSIIIDTFGLQKVELNAYLKGTEFIKNVLHERRETSYKGKTPAVGKQDDIIGHSELGTPMWDTLIIKGDTYEDRTYGTVTYPDIQINTVLINITQSHNLVLTELQGKDNEVIEYIGKKSFRINFKGGFFGNNNNRPKNEISDFKKMINSNKILTVKQCGFLSEWDIVEFAVMDKSIPQTMGGYNYQLFEFNAIQNISVILGSKKSA
jgi:hypothetical protein